MFRKNTAGQFIHFSMISTTDGSPVTGITPTVRRCIDGTFAAGDGTVTEDTGLGFYSYEMSQADTNGNNIGFRFIGTGAIDTVVNIVTTAANPTDSVRFGLTALPNAAADAAGGLPISDAGGLDLDGLNTNVSAVLADTGTDGVVVAAGSKTGYALTAAYDFAKGTTAVTESYAANGAAPTPVQALMGIHQMLMDFSISGTSLTVKKLDNSTTAFVVTLDDASSPTGAART